MFSPSWLTMGLIALGLTHVLIVLVTVYFHRAMAHRSVNLHPAILRVCRFLSWFLMGMDPREFAAVHRKHHALCDTSEDPHSPVRFGWVTVLFKGLKLYRVEADNPETLEKYGKGLPVDPWEGFYRRHHWLGLLLQACLLTALLGWPGLLLWSVILLWIPFWAAGVVNGLGHRFGYRRFPTEDHSTNLVPWGFWIGGEELHNNHHARPSSPKFSAAWYEVDLGWGYIRVLMALNLASLRAPLPEDAPLHPSRVRSLDVAIPSAAAVLLADRYHWMRTLYHAFEKEAGERLSKVGFRRWKGFSRRLLPGRRLTSRVEEGLRDPVLAHLWKLESTLRDMWVHRLRPQELSQSLQGWFEEARRVGPHLSAWCDRWDPSLRPA